MNYTLPDFTAHLGMNLFFARLLNARPEWARKDVRIDSVYGCFPNCVMNGGRAYVGKRATPAQMRDMFARLAAEGVHPRCGACVPLAPFLLMRWKAGASFAAGAR